jgi:hypothetical protein
MTCTAGPLQILPSALLRHRSICCYACLFFSPLHSPRSAPPHSLRLSPATKSICISLARASPFHSPPLFFPPLRTAVVPVASKDVDRAAGRQRHPEVGPGGRRLPRGRHLRPAAGARLVQVQVVEVHPWPLKNIIEPSVSVSIAFTIYTVTAASSREAYALGTSSTAPACARSQPRTYSRPGEWCITESKRLLQVGSMGYIEGMGYGE